MSIYFGDLRIKAAITLGLEDISKNPWLINDIIGDSIGNPYLQKLYGGQIESCKQWFSNNRINIFMSLRDDKVEFPAIIIEVGSSNEKEGLKHMADLSTEKVSLLPSEINRPIPYVVRPILGSYDSVSGLFTFTQTPDLSIVSEGMVLVNPATGIGYAVQSVVNATQVQLLTGLTISTNTYGIIPKYQYFETRIGHSFFQEEYVVSCKAMDQQTNLWLHAIAVYSLLRYRQTLLEAEGGAESMIKSGKMYPDQDYSDNSQIIFSRDINLSLQVENTFFMQPHRFIENIALPGPLKIVSNLDGTDDPSQVNWEAMRDLAYQNE